MRGTRHHTGWDWAAAIGASLLVLALSGCTGEPSDEVTAPSFEPAPTVSEAPEAAPAPSSAEPSTAPSQAAPELPEAATEQTPEGAVAFTEWWFETLNYATETGDTEALRAASDPGCSFCNALAQQIDDAVQSDGRIEGGLASVEVSPPGGLEARGINLAVFVTLDATQIVSPDGETLEAYPSSQDEAFIASVLQIKDQWIMGELS